MMDWAEKLLETAKDYDVITFDVFDTLIIRDVAKPVDVFWLNDGLLFRYKRIIAEMMARKHSENEEITLEDIYKYLPKRDLKNEICIEKKVCRANPVMKFVYNELKKQGKRMFAISDMYLDEATISEILYNAGYQFEKIYVSSQYGVCKHSGKLYDFFCKEQGILPGTILHIGDSKCADIEGAGKAGIKGFSVLGFENRLLYSKLPKHFFYLIKSERKCNILRLRSFINNNIEIFDNRCEKIGYEILGPILIGYVQWIHEKKNEYEFTKLFFLARDMRMFFDLYHECYKADESYYLEISRQAIRNSADNPEYLCDYLRNKGCFGNVAVVDVGWRGFTQSVIDMYAKSIDEKTDIGGLYMGFTAGVRYFKHSHKTEACYIKKGSRKREAMIYAALLESFIGANEPQTTGYEKGGSPVFNDANRNEKNIEYMQRGAVKFAKDWIAIGNPAIPLNDVFNSFYNIFSKPLDEDIQLLGNCEFDHCTHGKLINFKEKKYYFLHPIEWFKDLRSSAWKGAFFKKSFIFPNVIYRLYMFFDSWFICAKDYKKLKGMTVVGMMRDYE